jgi:hypothetical protein
MAIKEVKLGQMYKTDSGFAAAELRCAIYKAGDKVFYLSQNKNSFWFDWGSENSWLNLLNLPPADEATKEKFDISNADILDLRDIIRGIWQPFPF